MSTSDYVDRREMLDKFIMKWKWRVEMSWRGVLTIQTLPTARNVKQCAHRDANPQAKSVLGTLALANVYASWNMCKLVDQTVYVLVLATGQGGSDICLSLCLLWSSHDVGLDMDRTYSSKGGSANACESCQLGKTEKDLWLSQWLFIWCMEARMRMETS